LSTYAGLDQVRGSNVSPLRESYTGSYNYSRSQQSLKGELDQNSYMMRSLPVDSQAIRTYDREGSRSKSPDYYNRHLENTHPLKASPPHSSAFNQSGYGARGDHRQVPNDNSSLLKSEIDMLNKRLDKIDQHCMEFTKMATEKAKLEDNLKNLAYLHMLEAEQTGKVGSA